MKTPTQIHRQRLMAGINELDYDLIDETIESMEKSGDHATWETLLENCVIDSRGRFFASTDLTLDAGLQQHADYALIELICRAPDTLVVNETLIKDQITRLLLREQPGLDDSRRKSWKFPQSIYRLCALEALDLFGFNISGLPDGISALPALRRLVLARTGVIELPADIGRSPRLEHLDLSLNRLSTIPRQVAEIRSLTSLFLDGNMLSDLPSALAGLERLQVIRLPENYFTQFPEVLTQISRLTTINLSYNKLSTPFPDVMTNMQCLQELDLRGNNKLEFVPPGFSALGQQKDLKYVKSDMEIGHPADMTTGVEPLHTNGQAIDGEESMDRKDLVPDDQTIEWLEALQHYWISGDPDHERAGIALVNSLNEPALYRLLLRCASIQNGKLLLKTSKDPNPDFPTINKLSHLIQLLKGTDDPILREAFDLSTITYVEMDHDALFMDGINTILPAVEVLNLMLEGDPPRGILPGFLQLKTLFIGTEARFRELTIEGSAMLEDFEMLGRQSGSINLCNCPQLKKITLTGHRYKSIRIMNCPMLSEIKLNIRDTTPLHIEGCPAVRTFTQDVPGDFHPFHFGDVSSLEVVQLGSPGNLPLITRLLESAQLTEVSISYRNMHPPKHDTRAAFPECRSRKLRKLRISNTGIKKIPAWIFQQTELEKLELADNELEEIPVDWCSCRSLENIGLSRNRIFELDEDIRFPPSLKKLTLCENRLSTLPATLAGLPSLEQLLLCTQSSEKKEETTLRKIPPELSGKPGLNIHINLEDIDHRKMIAEGLAWRTSVFGKPVEPLKHKNPRWS
jgi:Leucine-rich repeat (LRR) protein